jgi:hypothetical protein
MLVDDMRPRGFVFLPTPAFIREAIVHLQYGPTLDLAVAFISSDWEELISTYSGKLRVICWLSSTNTNPYAVESMMNRPNTEVRCRHSMHCKVYICPGTAAVVGSANLSRAALSEADISGQDEAAVSTTDLKMVNRIAAWFNELWNDKATQRIRPPQLAAAKQAWKKAAQSRKGSPTRANAQAVVPVLPTKFDTAILSYARQVRSLHLNPDIGPAVKFVTSLTPATMTNDERLKLVQYITSWTGHPGKYRNFLRQPLAKVRNGLDVLFDPALDPEARLKMIQSRGFLNGLGMPTLSLLLYWRNPKTFVPYNFRTETFLKDFNLQSRGMSGSSPRCYGTWLRWAARAAHALGLPTTGHLDRIVTRYHSDRYE